jgi:hypothetical protein
MIDNQQNIFIGGVDKDTDYRVIKSDRLVGALNAEFMSEEEGRITSVEPMHSSSLAYTIPDVTAQNLRFRITYGGVSAEHVLQLVNEATGVAILTTPPTIGANMAAVVSTMNTFLNVYGYDIVLFGSSADPYYVLELENTTGTFLNISPVWVVNGSDNLAIILQYAYEVDATLSQIGGCNVDNLEFSFSATSNGGISEIGIAKKDSGVWSYTRILRSPYLNFLHSEFIDIRVEDIGNNQYAVYYTNNANKPACLYISKTFTTDCVLKYTLTSFAVPTDGYIVYGFELQQTNLQLINNSATVTYSDQLQNGGALLAGSYRYSVRFGINGTGNTTEWSVLTANAIPVFKTSVNNPTAYIRIQGDKSGESTGKANVLFVENAMPNVFNFIELACIYHAELSTVAYIVGKYDVTGDDVLITHTGLEQGTQNLDLGELPQSEPVFLSAKTLEIKKNRLNIANVKVASDENNILAISQGVTITPQKKELVGVGRFSYDSPDFITISSENGYAPWNPTQNSPQFGVRIPIVFPNVSPLTSDYDDTNGRYTCSVSGDYNFKFGFGITGSASFFLPTSFIELVKVSGATTTVLTTVPVLSSGFFDTTVSCLAGDYLFLAATFQFDTTVNYLFTNATSGTGFSVSRLTSSSYAFKDTKVGEYQLPENCAKYVGYTVNEKYPIFMKTHHKSGYISSPYYCGIFDNDWGGDAGLFTNNSPADSYVTYAYYANISNIFISPLRNLEDPVIGISFWRGICNPTVLGTGVVMPADSFDVDRYMSGFYSSIPTSYGAYGSAVGATDNRRKFAMFFSHDTRINQVEPVEGDTLKTYAPTTVLNNFSGIKSPRVANGLGSYAEYSGYLGALIEEDVTVTDGVYNSFDKAISEVDNTQPQIQSGSLNYRPNINVKNKASGSMENISIAVDNFIDPNPMVSLGIDNGLYTAQYIRNISNQYDIQSVKIVPTGTYVKIDQNTPAYLNNVQVFGGDTYTQKNILKVRYWSNFNSNDVRTSFITYYGQNKINTQLFYNDNEAPKATWNLQGHLSISDYLFPFLSAEEVVEEQFSYDKAYSAVYPLSATAYNSKLPQQSKYGSRIYYSSQKPVNSLQDFYRKIKPLDFKDIDPKNGDIVRITDINDIIMTHQPNAVTTLPYISDVALSAEDGSLYVGNGGVYSQRESIVSTFGASFASAVCVGKNRNGNSQAYWLNTVYKKLLRYGYDGIRVISEENNYRTFMLQNVRGDFSENSIQMGFDSSRQSLFSTVFGDTDFSFVFNEKFNAFTGDFKPTPYRYFPFMDSLITPNSYPTLTNEVHELFGGSGYLVWYEFTPNEITSTFDLEFVVNKQPSVSKRAIAIALNVGEAHSTGASPTMTVSSQSQTSTVNPIDWQLRRGELVVAVRNDAGDAPIVGQWVKFKLSSQQFYRIFASISRFRYASRMAVK